MLGRIEPGGTSMKTVEIAPVSNRAHRDEDDGLTPKVKIAGLFKNKCTELGHGGLSHFEAFGQALRKLLEYTAELDVSVVAVRVQFQRMLELYSSELQVTRRLDRRAVQLDQQGEVAGRHAAF